MHPKRPCRIVFCNNNRRNHHTTVTKGNSVDMDDGFKYKPPQTPLKVIYFDRDIIVVDKPSGLLSVPGRGADRKDSVYTRILKTHPLAQVVHRLDMDTSGVMVFALRRKAERALDRQFHDRTVKKQYMAIVEGQMSKEHGIIDKPLKPDPQRTLRHIVDQTGKPAQTKYQVRTILDNATLVDLYPITGRSHQLRVHLAAIGHAIQGDRFYGDSSTAKRLMLQGLATDLPQGQRKDRSPQGLQPTTPKNRSTDSC